ncbi:hypothetical protein N7520_008297 [Penicillium odoratum]|uniref:uncharacterized protein n=1 Tax=Penicillium odoratum TaxID=1167516 RepID=UPI002547A071|nr:uncharacterized protein N7520_008297 [Penicillium odoratum]KAJ5761141.1 hypothetical protein N7520_008297 [Penicillium odoratum]
MDTSVIGPVTVMESFIEQFGKHSAAVHGILVSCILLCAALGSLFAGRLADRLGRPKAMAFGAAVFTVGIILEAAAVKLLMFAVGRVIEGLGYGLYFSTQTVYICEISPPKARGPLTLGPQFMTCMALVVGYFISYGTVNIPGSLSWRLPFIIIVVMAILYLFINLFVLPDQQEDREVDDPTTILSQSNPAREEMGQEANFQSLWTPDVRKQTFLAVFLLGFLQLCGIDAFLYYAPLIFQQAGLESQEASFLASGVSAIAIVATNIPATLLADKWGRRTSTVLVVGWSSCLSISTALCRPRPRVWAPKIQPQHTRAQAISLGYGANWVCNFFVAFVCPILLDKSVPSAYLLFGGCTAAATIVSFFYMVETKGKTLAEIERAFKTRIPVASAAIPMARMVHADHEVKAV